MENKKSFLLAVITLVLVAAVLAFNFIAFAAGNNRTLSASAPAAGERVPENDVAAVYGQGRITVKPDIAIITFGVENTSPDPKAAQDGNSARMEKVMAALKNAGVSDADIQTADYNVYQNTGNDGKEPGYRVTNLIQVTVKQIDRAGGIVKAAYDAGANRFSGIRFDLIERQKAYLDALDLAMGRAYEKAEFLAQKAGRKISGVMEVEEANTGISTPYYSPYSNFSPGESAAGSPADYAAGLVSSGELVITAAVNVKYKLE